MMPYYQAKFNYKHTSSLEDIVKIVIFWLYSLLVSCFFEAHQSPQQSHAEGHTEQTAATSGENHC